MNRTCIIPSPGTEIHRQQSVQHPILGEIKVDQQLAEVLPMLWQAGVSTLYSCQCSVADQKGYILFPSTRDAERFLELSAGKVDADPSSLFQRVRRAQHSFPEAESNSWEIWTTLIDQANEHWTQGEVQRLPFFKIRCSVRFPHSDIKILKRNLASAVG